MVLKKKLIMRNGIEAEYHRISGIRVATGGMYEVGVQSFFTKKDRDEGRRMVDEQTVFLPAEKIDAVIAAQYKLIKELPDYADAEDVIEEPKTKDETELAPAGPTETKE